MKISIIGTGYVGLVTGTCFAEMGNQVICVDVDEKKINDLKKGIIPIYEPGLEELVQNNYKKGSLQFTLDIKEALLATDMVFIAVGTPMGEDGSADLQYVLGVAKQIGQLMGHPMIAVDKSTVPVGTADKVRATIQEELKKRNTIIDFDVVSNPEFLKEGDAVNDFMKPDRVVIGVENEKSEKTLRALYAPFVRKYNRIICMDIRSAELTKYAANCMLATKISFINEMANICERLGADVNQVRLGIGSDERIGYHFIYPGVGYGGSCFPKDVSALIRTAEAHNYEPRILKSVEDVNRDQKSLIVKKIIHKYGEDLTGMIFAVWGLAFKPNTDDMREAPSIVIINELVKRGAIIRAYDPEATQQAKECYLKDVENIQYFDNKYDALYNADAMILVTEWKEFRSPVFEEIAKRLKGKDVFDGRNIYLKISGQNALNFFFIGK
jgi:UDPglucose 6-dehydrogenase